MTVSAHNGHFGVSGVQNHSCGDFFPIVSYCVGSADHRAASAFGVERHTYDDYDGHQADLARMKRAELITDAIIAAKYRGTGCSNPVDGSDSPDSGYVVGLPGYETKWVCSGLKYNTVYADVLGKLERIDRIKNNGRPVCIGSWIYRGELYCDVSVVFDNRDEALRCANFWAQIAIYDLNEGVEIIVE